MFACKGCEAKESEINYLRGLVKQLSAAQNPTLYHLDQSPMSATGYYGDGQDDLIEYDPFGSRVLVKEQPKES